ncbi:MAG: ATP-binding protein [Desulfovibrionales bacterium]
MAQKSDQIFGQGEDRYIQPYGDLTSLNTRRFLSRLVGRELLLDIAQNYLDLLETSSAVYEENGDYALGIFSSGWCRFLDAASRNLCGNVSNREALDCGKWLCHESCWSDISKRCIQSGRPMDDACHGGLRIYAVPIMYKGRAVGAINFGYGNPPTDKEELAGIAQKYQVDVPELEKTAKEYNPRSQEMVESAKKNLQLSARFIEEIIERKQTEEKLRQSERDLEAELNATRLLQQVSTRLIQADDLDLLYEQILDTAVEVVNADFASIQLLHPERGPRGELQLLGHRGFNEHAVRSWKWISPESGTTCGLALCTGQRVDISDLENCTQFSKDFARKIYLQTGIRSVQSTPLYSRKGNLLGMLSTHWHNPHQLTHREIRILDVLARQAADLIDRKQAEEKIRDFAGKLEARVVERTQELEQANKAKDQFLANISHEIRTPLAGILGLAELSMDEELQGELRENLEMIRYSAHSLKSIIDDILDFSAIEAQTLPLRPTEFSLRTELAKTAGSIRNQFASKGIPIELTVGNDVPDRIITDPDRLRQILTNFLSNAMKFTETGKVELTVRCAGPDNLCFSVSDTGLGIPRERIHEIFQSFTQLDPTLTKRFGGTGLGLSISKKLAELLGGEIKVQSEPGHGSTFTLILPLEIPQAKGKSGQNGCEHQTTEVPPLCILLAEDNPVNQIVIQKHLTEQGHKVHAVRTGKEAVAETAESKYDLILMDIQMPEMDGIKATKHIRSNLSGKSDIPIIALTAYAMKGDRERFLAAGMNGYVSKPIDFTTLTELIAEIFSDSPRESAM